MDTYYGALLFLIFILLSFFQKKSIKEMNSAEISFEDALLSYTSSLIFMFSSFFSTIAFILSGNLFLFLFVFLGTFYFFKKSIFYLTRRKLLAYIESNNMIEMYLTNFKIKLIYLFLVFLLVLFFTPSISKYALKENILFYVINNLSFIFIFAPRFFICSDELIYYCYRTYLHLEEKKN